MRDDVRRAFDEMTEAPHPALRSAVRSRLQGAPGEETPRAWRMVVAGSLVAGLALLGLVTGVTLLSRGVAPNNPVPGPAAATSPSPTPTAAPSPIPSATPTATPLPAASIPACLSATDGRSSSMANVTDVRVGTFAGYDRFVIEFDGPVPAFSITPQASPVFMQDATGQNLQLQGSSGIKVVVHGASATDLNGHPTFTGPNDRTPNFPVLKEARLVGDFERTYSWGLGVTNPGCTKVSILTGPNRLVIDLTRS